jgi:tetratricopeptide (TPR) repeat protein
MTLRSRRFLGWQATGIGLALWLLTSAPVIAGVEAELAFHRGVAAFGRGDNAAARRDFEIVVKEDPDDSAAWHYLGMIDQAEGFDEAAVENLERAVEADPENTDARVDLAASLIKLGRIRDARLLLDQVLTEEPDRADAQLYAGIIAYRERSYREAVERLQNASELDPDLELEASYYLGLAQAFSGDLDASAGAFSVVEQTEPNHPLGRSAAELRNQVRPKRRIWALALTGGLEYDSNISVTGDAALEKDDGRGVIRVQGMVRPVDTKRGTLDFGYDGYMGLYFHESELSQMTHLVWTAGSLAIGPVRLQARYDYAYTTLDLTSSFRQLHRVTAGIAIPTGTWGVAQLYYQFQDFDYMQRVIDPAFDRDGPDHSIGANEFFFLPEPFSYARLGARIFRYRPDGTEFAHDGLEVSTGGEMALPWEFGLQLLYVYQLRDYEYRSVVDPLGRRRQDNGHLLVVELSHHIWAGLSLSVAGSFTFNGSNIRVFDFDRQIIGSYLRYEF